MADRHKARELAFKGLYSWELNKFTTFTDITNIEKFSSPFGEEIFNGVVNNIDNIDEILTSSIEHWDKERLEKVDLSILRLSIYSLLYQRDISKVITINEAINISKEFGSEKSYKFINGVLDSIVI